MIVNKKRERGLEGNKTISDVNCRGLKKGTQGQDLREEMEG